MPTINPSNFTAQITKTVTPADLGFTASFTVPAGYRLVGFGEYYKSSQEAWRFVQRENPVDDSYKNDKGYTRREETY